MTNIGAYTLAPTMGILKDIRTNRLAQLTGRCNNGLLVVFLLSLARSSDER